MKKFGERLGYFVYMGLLGIIMAALYIAIFLLRVGVYVVSIPFALVRGKLPKWSEKSFHPVVDTPS